MPLDVYQQRDVDVMKHPSQWPYNVLPLIQRGSRRSGFLVDNQRPRVYFGSVWDPQMQVTPLRNIPFRDYGDFGSIVRDGWRVD